MGAKRIGVAVASAWMIAAVGCSKSSTPAPEGTAALPAGVLRIATARGQTALRVRIADTEATRRRGLMGVRDLAPDEGMAFVFPAPTSAAFWMKDTRIPLSIAFWGRGGVILSVQEMRPCSAAPCALYSPGHPFAGAAEANAGWFTAHGVRPGDRAVLVRVNATPTYP